MTKEEALELCDYLEGNDASLEGQCKAAAFIRKALAQPPLPVQELERKTLKLALETLCVAVEPKKGKVYAREFEPIDCFAMHEQAITDIKEALAQPPLPVQEPKHIVNVVIAHIKDLRKCVVELQKHGGFDETAAEIGVAADELEAALANPPAAQPAAQQHPLTEVQIEAGRRAPWGFNLDAFTAGAKFAEAALKEKNT